MAHKEDVLYQHIEKLVQYLGFLEELKSKCCALSMVQSTVILAIGNTHELSVIGLAEQLRLDKSSASRHVTNLVDLGYVIRTESQEDRRYFVLTLSNKGKNAYDTIQIATKKYYETIFKNMKTEDKDKLQQGLNALLIAIKESDCC